MMTFKCNTKPVVESAKLAILNANVSAFHKKSCVVEISATSNELRINVEASRIMTEVKIPGHGEGEDTSIFVDAMMYKNLVGTLDSDIVEFEFTDNALTVHSNASKFNIPKVIDSTDMSFARPREPIGESIKLESSMWQFISNNQEYALSKSFVHPVYTYVKISEDGYVLTGDVDSSLFTGSDQSPFMDCLLSDTIVNLLVSLPDNASAYKSDKNIILAFAQESYSYRSEIQPIYESDEGVGDYMAGAIRPLLNPTSNYGTIEKDKLVKFLSQTNILSTGQGATVTIVAKDDAIEVSNDSSKTILSSEHHIDTPFEGTFNLSSLYSVINHMVDDKMTVSASMNDGEVSGMLFWDTHIATVLGIIEEE